MVCVRSIISRIKGAFLFIDTSCFLSPDPSTFVYGKQPTGDELWWYIRVGFTPLGDMGSIAFGGCRGYSGRG